MIRLLIIVLLIQLSIMGYIVKESYEGRQDIVAAARQDCMVADKDREAAAVIGQAVLDGFYDTDGIQRGKNSASRNVAEADIRATVDGLELRGEIKCEEVFQDAEIWP